MILRKETSDKGNICYNLSVASLVENSLKRNEGVLTSKGALQVTTGKYTGRSPKDKYIVREPSVERYVEWGDVNRPLSQHHFENLYIKALSYMENKELFVSDGYAGCDEQYRLPIRVINS